VTVNADEFMAMHEATLAETGHKLPPGVSSCQRRDYEIHTGERDEDNARRIGGSAAYRLVGRMAGLMRAN
jgi:hypothetical protein